MLCTMGIQTFPVPSSRDSKSFWSIRVRWYRMKPQLVVSFSDDVSTVKKFLVSAAIVVIVIIGVGTFFAKRDPKRDFVHDTAMHYRVQQQNLGAPMMPMSVMKGLPVAPSSAASSDPNPFTFPYNPPPSPATVQSYDYNFHCDRTMPILSGASSTCSSSQIYMGSEASCLNRQGRSNGNPRKFRPTSLIRPNSPCSTEGYESSCFFSDRGCVPPPASPIPIPKNAPLYGELSPNASRRDPGFV